jgi:exonuclease V gamma subunit
MAKDLLKPERKVTVDIATLSKFARHPCKFYFEKTLGFFLEEEKKGDNKEFFVSPLERSFLRKDSLHKPLERILENAKAKGSLPIGFFSEIAKNQVAQEVEKFRENLLSMEVKEEDIFKVCLKSSCKALFWQGKSLQMPAVVLKHDDVECTFVGDFAEVSSEGLLFHGEDSLEDLVKVWPLYLVFQNLPDSEFLPKRDLLLTKEGKRKSFHLADSKQALFSYLSYFALAQKHISPLFPKWADTLLLGEEKDFEKDVRSFQNPSSQTYKDRYMDWILTRDGLPDTRLVFQNWSSYLRDVFSSLLAMKKEGKR